MQGADTAQPPENQSHQYSKCIYIASSLREKGEGKMTFFVRNYRYVWFEFTDNKLNDVL